MAFATASGIDPHQPDGERSKRGVGHSVYNSAHRPQARRLPRPESRNSAVPLLDGVDTIDCRHDSNGQLIGGSIIVEVMNCSMPPLDPRELGCAPPLGSLSAVTHFNDLVTRIVAPNPSAMTLDGTNTYLLSSPGSGVCVVIDPGPKLVDHLERVESEIANADAEVAMVLVTHHHLDHSAAAKSWAARWGCKVAAHSSEVTGLEGQVLSGIGQVLKFGALQIEVVATPGHCADHLSFRLDGGELFSGDHVLGRGTSVVTWPDGDLTSYIESLHKLQKLKIATLFPGHGPELVEDTPEKVIEYYLAHRAHREAQVVKVLGAGPMVVEQIVDAIYVDLKVDLRSAAVQSTRACLEKLKMESRVEEYPRSVWNISKRGPHSAISK